jgi:anthranilate synthase component 1
MSARAVRPIAREVAPGGRAPLDLFRRLRRSGAECFLLESGEGDEAMARYTFLGVAPSARLTVRGSAVEVEASGERRAARGTVLEALDGLAVTEGYQPDPDLPPFCGGAVGYLSYDAARLFEAVPDRHPREGGIPDALFLRFDAVAVFDHARGRLLLVTSSDAGATAAAQERLDSLQAALDGPSPGPPGPDARGLEPGAFTPAMPRERFLRAVADGKEAILAGEVYQVVLSQRWTAPLGCDPLSVYAALRGLNPSPYLFYLETREAAILGASPEMLVRCRDGVAETRPIAGTIRRGADAAEDEALADRLRADPKERAEHVMLVDLARNDLGRVSQIGSVHVTRSAEVERYSHVQHLVSEVRGRLAPGKRSTDLLASAFPAGTLTGAPKIRAMELIDELECCRRGIYGGAVGYLDRSGNLDMAIAIRTAVVVRGICRIQAGAGIVADSVPENEYSEAESKAQALFDAVEAARHAAAGRTGSAR